MAQSRGDGRLPPYVAYRTFDNYLGLLREDGLPARIDPSVLRGVSRATQSQLRGALRYLGLIDDEGLPAEDLRRLLDEPQAGRALALRGALQRSYGFLLGTSQSGFDLKTATAEQLDEQFRAAGLSGDTVRKGESFFLAAAQAANITVSPYLRSGRDRAAASRAPRRGARRQPARAGTDEVGPALLPSGQGLSPLPEDIPRAAYLVQMLVSRFPAFNPNWGDEAQLKWLVAFERLLEMVDRHLADRQPH